MVHMTVIIVRLYAMIGKQAERNIPRDGVIIVVVWDVL
jgi:hypothetical protein